MEPIKSNPGEMTAEEQSRMLTLLNQFLSQAAQNTSKVSQASDEEWKEITKSEHIVTSGVELKAKTQATRVQEDLEDLIASSKGSRILTGTIIGVRSTNSDNNVSTWVAEVQYGNDTCKVYIPSYLLYHYDITKYKDPGKENEVHRHMQDMIGADINFVVRHVDKATKTAYASRLQALQQEAQANYVRVTRNGKPRATVGSIVEAKVVAVRNHAIVVDALGAEAIIPAKTGDNRLSWEVIPDCHDMFQINDIIPVKIMDMKEVNVEKYSDKYSLVSVKLSHKDTQPNPLDEYWDTITEGEIGMATITAIREGNVYCKYKNRVTILCKYPERGTEPTVGQRRNVKITLKKNEAGEGKRIFGTFTSF